MSCKITTLFFLVNGFMTFFLSIIPVLSVVKAIIVRSVSGIDGQTRALIDSKQRSVFQSGGE